MVTSSMVGGCETSGGKDNRYSLKAGAGEVKEKYKSSTGVPKVIKRKLWLGKRLWSFARPMVNFLQSNHKHQ